MSAQSAATALKEACQTQGTPAITRKITACVACRKLKIKCFMDDGKPPCKRCRGRNLSCTVNKSIQMILDSDITWKEQMQARLEELERQVADGGLQVSQHSNPAPSGRHITNDETAHSFRQPLTIVARHGGSKSTAQTSLNFSCSLGAFPASALTGLPLDDRGESPSTRPDLLTRGVITDSNAQELYQFYQTHLNHLIYDVLSIADTLADLREKSSLLTAAVCTVAAYCSAANCYQDCLAAFQAELSAELFSQAHSFHDVRALCIGSFWLPGLSAALSALAVRFASELNLHRCITKMPHGDPKCYERTRLYFAVVICDHQCSLVHGRPPMTRAMRSLRNPRALLQSRFSVPADIKLISHLELWTLNSRVLDSFGADIGTPFPVQERGKDLSQLADYFDRWKQQWTDLIARRMDLDSAAGPVLKLYYNAAKLSLFAHIFRGSSAGITSSFPSGSEVAEDFQLEAIASALSLIQSLVESRTFIQQLPSYFSATLAFAVVLLLGVCSSPNLQQVIQGKRDEIIDALLRLSGLLSGLTLMLHQSHPLNGVGPSLDEALKRTTRAGTRSDQNSDTTVQPSVMIFAGGGFDFTPNGSHFHFDDAQFPQQQLTSQDTFQATMASDIDWSLFPVDFSAEFPDITTTTTS